MEENRSMTGVRLFRSRDSRGEQSTAEIERAFQIKRNTEKMSNEMALKFKATNTKPNNQNK